MEAQDFFGLLLIAIQKRLKEKVPEIRYVNQDLGQLELENPPVSWPCFLVDFTDTAYSDLLLGEQEGELNFSGRLGFNPFSQTSNLQEEEIRKKGLAYYALEAKLNAALHGWQPTYDTGVPDGDGNAVYAPLCQPLSRRRAATERREEDTFRVRGLMFTTGFHDDTASPERYTINPDLLLEFELLKDEES